MKSADASRYQPRRRYLWLTLGVIGILVIGALIWTGVRALLLKDELESAVALASQLRDEIAGADLASSRSTFDELAAHAETAASLSGDPVWRIVEVLPFVGPNLAGARVAAHHVDELSRRVVLPLLKLEGQLDGLVSEDGLDLSATVQAQAPLTDAERAVNDALSDLEALDEGSMIAPVAEGVHTLRSYLRETRPLIAGAAEAVRLLPPMLGEKEPRSILIVVQNGAELRTGGGLTGAFVELRAEGGRLQIVDQASSPDFPVSDRPILPLPDSVVALYGDRIGRYVMNLTAPADFELSGELASEWWNLRAGHRPDTVIAVDVPVLGALLASTGPLDVPGWGEVNSENVVERLLVDPYLTLEADGAQNALFQEVASQVFVRLLTPGLDPVALATNLAGPIEAGRVSVWSSRPEEQKSFANSDLGGLAARQRLAGKDAFAVYLNDRTGAKMDGFLGVSLAASVATCRADDRRDITIAVTLANHAPGDASTLPDLMTGAGLSGVPRGDISTLVTVGAPPGTFIGGVTVDGAHVRSVSVDNLAGFTATQAQSDLSPGGDQTLEFHFTASEPGDVDPTILHTPTLGNTEVILDDALSCP